MKNDEKYPVIFEIAQYSDSILGDTLNLYFVTCVANKLQIDTLAEAIKIQNTVKIDDDEFVVTGLYTQQKIEHLLAYFNKRAKEWRGQYQSISKAVVAACNTALKIA
jgi:hypothetical protein